jgi:hypothetical protein
MTAATCFSTPFARAVRFLPADVDLVFASPDGTHLALLDRSLVRLGVDNPHARRRDENVINVAAFRLRFLFPTSQRRRVRPSLQPLQRRGHRIAGGCLRPGSPSAARLRPPRTHRRRPRSAAFRRVRSRGRSPASSHDPKSLRNLSTTRCHKSRTPLGTAAVADEGRRVVAGPAAAGSDDESDTEPEEPAPGRGAAVRSIDEPTLDTVVEGVNSARTQNGHIRNDTRDVSRHIPGVRLRSICRRNCVASDRGCTRVTGKEGVDGSSPSEGSAELAANRLVSLAVSTTIQRRDVHQTSTRRLRDHSLAPNSA